MLTSGFIRATICLSAGRTFASPCSAAQFSISCALAKNKTGVPRETDVLIIGGGIIGQSIAFFIKHEQKHVNVTLVERDMTYKIASSALSAASMRQQFSLPENIRLSIFTAQFLFKAHDLLDVKGYDDSIDMNFHAVPYLVLAENDQQAAILQNNVKIQRENGAAVTLLSPSEIKTRFPWLNAKKVNVGSLGLDNEGHFDQWLLMAALKRRNIASGVHYVHGEVEGFEMSKSVDGKVQTVAAIVRDLSTRDLVMARKTSPETMKFHKAIISSGCWSGKVAAKLGLGRLDGPVECRTQLPVEPRKRYRYLVHCPKGPGRHCPMVCDPRGVFFRREGVRGHILVGGMLPDEIEPDLTYLEPDVQRFYEKLWPVLAERAPFFEECKMTHSWAGYYDYNTFDQNLIIGPHNYFKNIFFATGLSGHGIMHSAGVGRAISELILYGKYKTIDLNRFSFDRIVANRPIRDPTIM